MRYRSRPVQIEAEQWLGPREGITFGQLQDWGAPVYRDAGTSALILSTGGGGCTVNIGDWIVLAPTGWYRVTDAAFRARYDVAAEDQAVPGFATVTVERVAFSRKVGDTFEWRHGGLTQAEAEAGGWTALYDVQVPG